MSQIKYLNTILLCIVVALFAWFFSSSLSIAYHKAPQHDDAMFATVSKNFLNGYGWATSYGEKIPFNPDISTGPTLWIPAAIMISIFGNQSWIPAVTGAVMNITLAFLVLWQLHHLTRFRAAAFLSLLMAISLFAVNDFKTFTAYYTGCLLFIFALLFSLNQRYSQKIRFTSYGAFCAIGLYAKPLILLSFISALPFILLCEFRISRNFSKSLVTVLFGFLLTVSPWHLYKTTVLHNLGEKYNTAYQHYNEQFFKYHGTGIGQFEDADDKMTYLKKNANKNYHILTRFLQKEYNFPLYVIIVLLAATLFIALRRLMLTREKSPEEIVADISYTEVMFAGILGVVILINAAWYVLFSFAMTPGHTFFLTFFSFFLLFFLAATQARSNFMGVLLCVALPTLFSVRHAPLMEAYLFKVDDPYISNQDIEQTRQYLLDHPTRHPLASCGWQAGPWRLDFRLPQSENFVDCLNVLEDHLVLDEADYILQNPDINLMVNGRKISPTEHFFTQGLQHSVKAKFRWEGSPDFTLAIDSFSFVSSMKPKVYVLGPIADVCLKNLLFKQGVFIVCDVAFDQIKDKLDPTETARQLVDYQIWYRTRLKVY